MKLRRTRSIVIFLCTMVILMAFQLPAYAIKVTVIASTPAYHYGCAGSLYVYDPASIRMPDVQKVNSVCSSRTDEASLTEIGHSYQTGSNPQAFYATLYNGAYSIWAIADVTPGSTYRYWTGYDYRNNQHAFWFNSSTNLVAWKSIPNLTSGWPWTNAEKDYVNDPYSNNNGCYTALKYKNYDWGSWSSWSSPKTWRDEDVRYSNSFVAGDHVDVIYNGQ